MAASWRTKSQSPARQDAVRKRWSFLQELNEAVNDVRAAESRKLAQDGFEPILAKSRWCVLKRQENLTGQQRIRLRDLLKYNLQTVRAYLLKEQFQHVWGYDSPTWAGKFLDEWTTLAMRSRIEPMKKFARTLRNHRELLLNYFRAKSNSPAASSRV
jgi:transposase